MFTNVSNVRQTAPGNPALYFSEAVSVSSLARRESETTRPTMQWTTEKPIRPGFYWLKGSTAVSKPVTVVEVFHHYDIRSQIFVRFFDCECGMDVSGVDGEWYGPLQPPED